LPDYLLWCRQAASTAADAKAAAIFSGRVATSADDAGETAEYLCHAMLDLAEALPISKEGAGIRRALLPTKLFTPR
jgi:hypothetical protein